MKKLERSRESSVIGGVCGGLGEYFNLDPVIFRIAFVLLALAHGIGIVAYIVCWIAMPHREVGKVAETTPPKSDFVKYIPGIALIVIGAAFLFDDIFYWVSFSSLWPLILIVGGILLVYNSMRKKEEYHEGECRQN